MKKIFILTMTASLLYALAACGGGGGGSSTPSTTVYSTGITDPDFGTAGIVLEQNPNLSSDLCRAKDLAVQTDGKLVVVGFEDAQGAQSNAELSVMRLNVDGTKDANFGNNGFFSTSSSTGNIRAESVALQADGMIVVAVSHSESSRLRIYRLTTSGVADPNFNNSEGYRNIDPPANTTFADYTVSVNLTTHSPQRIVVVGSALNTNSNENLFFAGRLTSTGETDTTFASGGSTPGAYWSPSGYRSMSAAIQSSGKIVIAGQSGSHPNIDFMVARLTKEGDLDTTFGSGNTGFATMDIGGHNDTGMDVKIDGSQRIVVGGSAWNSGLSGSQHCVVRLTEDGVLDSSFGANADGKVIIPYSTEIGSCSSIAIQSDGQIVAAGSSGNKFGMTRLSADGIVDPAIETLTQDVGSSSSFVTDSLEAVALYLDPSDGVEKIYLAGDTQDLTNDVNEVVLVRYE